MNFIRDAALETKVREIVCHLLAAEAAIKIRFRLVTDVPFNARLVLSPTQHVVLINASMIRKSLFRHEDLELYAELAHEIGHVADMHKRGFPKIYSHLLHFVRAWPRTGHYLLYAYDWIMLLTGEYARAEVRADMYGIAILGRVSDHPEKVMLEQARCSLNITKKDRRVTFFELQMARIFAFWRIRNLQKFTR